MAALVAPLLGGDFFMSNYSEILCTLLWAVGKGIMELKTGCKASGSTQTPATRV